MADRIKGITVQIGGDTTGLSKALSGVNKQIKTTQNELKDVEKLLKLDPSNVKLLAQKQRLLAGAVEESKTKLDGLKAAEKEVKQQFKDGVIDQSKMDAFNRELIDAKESFDAAKKAAQEFGGVVAQEMQLAGQKVGEVGEKISGIGDKISGTGKALMPVTGAIVGAGTASVVAATDFETSMAKLSTIADTSKVSTEDLKAQILDVSNTYGVSASDIAEAAYNAISAGQDTEDAVQFVADAMQLAKAGFTDSGTAIDTLTTIMNAYGDASGSAADISDRLITAQNLGKTTVAELGSSMGKVIPTAAMYGVNLDNLASAYVTTTKNGISTAESTTYINGMLNELGKSGSTASNILKNKTGKSFKELMDSGMSLTDALQIIQDAADASGKSMADMFSSQEAAKAAATITQHADDFTESMDAMAESSGKTAEAFAVVDDTTAASMEKLKTSVQNLAIQLGDVLIPVVEAVVGHVQRIVDWLGSLDESQKKTIVTVAAIVAAVGPALIIIGKVVSGVGGIVGGLGTAIKVIATVVGIITGTVVPAIASVISLIAGTVIPAIAAFASMLAGAVVSAITAVVGLITGTVIPAIVGFVTTVGIVPIAIVAAVAAVIAAIALFGDQIQAVLQGVDDFLQGVFATDWTNIFGPVLGEVLNAFFANVKNIWDSIKMVFDGIIDFIRGVFTGDWERAWTGVKEIFGGIFDGLKAVAKAPLNAIIGMVNMAISGINGVIGGLNKIPGVNIGEIGKIPYLAKGGILSRGSAVVGEAGPELLTMSAGRAVVQPLTNNTTNHSASYGNVTINVYGAAGQSVNELADIVMEKMQGHVERREAVWT
jgi:TP901 family phage tail tape measure protein